MGVEGSRLAELRVSGVRGSEWDKGKGCSTWANKGFELGLTLGPQVKG